MKIYETSVRKPISTALIFIAAIILGLFSLNKLSVDLMPEMDIPAISVFTTYSGASAADIEVNITKVLEDNLNTVNNLKKITSESKDNISLLTLEFEWGSNLDEASNDIRDALGRAERLLPDEADKPQLFRFSTSMIPIMYLSVTAEESYNALYKILEDKISNPLNRINNVGSVSIMAAPVREVQVNVDPRKLEAYNISIEQIGQLIAQENMNIPAGNMDIGTETISLRTEGEFTGSEQLNALVVGTVNGKELRLADIASVKDTIEKITQEFMFNGKKGVQIVIQKQSGSNSVAIANEIKKKLPELQKTLPQDVELNMLLDSTENITNSINSLAETVMYAFIFVVLVVMLFLGKWRATLIIVCTIPVSLVCGFIYMFATGATLNIISLSSLSIAIGMVVDDAIVVLENINTHIERGSSPKEAAIYATNEVWLAVIATTLTIVAVFVPLTLVTGMAGIMFKQLGWIVTIVCCVSTVAAITLTPMMSALMLKVTDPKDKYKGLGIIFKPIEKALDALDNGYSNLLTWAVRHRALVVIVAAAIFLSSLFLLVRVPTELFPSSDNGQISVYVELPQGVNLEYTSKIARQIEGIFAEKYPEVETFGTSAGAAGSNSSIFAAMGKNGSHIINMTLIMKDYKDRDRDIFLLSDLMRQDLTLIPEIKEYTVSPGGGSGGGGNMSGSTVDIKIFGYDFDVTGNFAHELREVVRENVPGTRDITISREDMKPEYKVDFDREKLALYGLNTASVGTMVRNRINGLVASKYREEGEEYDIVVRYDEPFRVSIEDIENIVLYNNRGQGIKLKEVGKVIEYFTPPSIQREDRQRVVTVSVSMYGAALGEVAQGIQSELAKMNIPQGVDVVLGGSLEDQQEAFTDLITLLLLIVILVYIVMATQFESLREPFIIMLAVPFAFTGVFLALYLTNTPLSMIALIGSIMLVGIVVKNGIVLVDYTNLQRDRGLTLSQAVITAGKSRLRPVLMTTLTTILGMVPMAIGSGEGSEIWKPMGIAVIGGLTFSTVLTLIVVPVMYSLFGAGRMKKQRKRLAQELQMGAEE